MTWWCPCRPGVRATGVPWANASPRAVCAMASSSVRMAQTRRGATGELSGAPHPLPSVPFPTRRPGKVEGTLSHPQMALAGLPHSPLSSPLSICISNVTIIITHHSHYFNYTLPSLSCHSHGHCRPRHVSCCYRSPSSFLTRSLTGI